MCEEHWYGHKKPTVSNDGVRGKTPNMNHLSLNNQKELELHCLEQLSRCDWLAEKSYFHHIHHECGMFSRFPLLWNHQPTCSDPTYWFDLSIWKLPVWLMSRSMTPMAIHFHRPHYVMVRSAEINRTNMCRFVILFPPVHTNVWDIWGFNIIPSP